MIALLGRPNVLTKCSCTNSATHTPPNISMYPAHALEAEIVHFFLRYTQVLDHVGLDVGRDLGLHGRNIVEGVVQIKEQRVYWRWGRVDRHDSQYIFIVECIRICCERTKRCDAWKL